MRRVCSLCALLIAGACMHRPPSIEGAPGAPAQPNTYWYAPPSVAARVQRSPATPPPTAAMLGKLTMPDVVDLALRNNPATRLSWAQARAAADIFGASRGAFRNSIPYARHSRFRKQGDCRLTGRQVEEPRREWG